MEYNYNTFCIPVDTSMTYYGLYVPFEIWADITDLAVPNISPGRYMISNFGNLYDKKLGKYNTFYDDEGYNRT